MKPGLLPEWAPQDGVLITWPWPDGDWGPWYEAVEETYLDLSEAILFREQLIVLCRDKDVLARAHRRLEERGLLHPDRLHLHVVPCNDTWVRDYGPLTCSDGQALSLVDFRFDGWGGKYPAERDDQVTRQLHQAGLLGALPLARTEVVLEGGAIETDGAGTLMLGRHCVLESGRNPGLDQAAMERELLTRLHASRVLWVDHGLLQGDDTDGHIDTLARFLAPDTIAGCVCDDPADPHYESLAALRRQIGGFRQPGGLSYRIVELPLPDPVYDDDGNRLPASYANFLFINDALLLPTYRQPRTDRQARDILAAALPDTLIVPLDAWPLIQQYGGIHCATLQLPRGVLGDRAASA